MHRPQDPFLQEGIEIDSRNVLVRVQVVARLPVVRDELLRVAVEFLGDPVGIDDSRASAHERTLGTRTKNRQSPADSTHIRAIVHLDALPRSGDDTPSQTW